MRTETLRGRKDDPRAKPSSGGDLSFARVFNYVLARCAGRPYAVWAAWAAAPAARRPVTPAWAIEPA